MNQPDQSHDRDREHGHEHAHAEIGQSGRPGYYDIMETAVRELLVERKLIGPTRFAAKSRSWTPVPLHSARRSWRAPG
jgi:hypothetical protein